MNNFKFAMEKEIYEQPAVIKKLLKAYVNNEKILFDIPKEIQKICFIASGSSYHCGAIAAELMKTFLDLDAEAFYSGEFFTSKNTNWDKRLFIFISQSGETSDTLKVMQEIHKHTNNILCISNTQNSTMWNLAKYQIYTMAGKEKSIASTKALSAQLFCILLLILAIKQNQGKDISENINNLKKLPDFLEEELNSNNNIIEIASELTSFDSIEILGSRIFYGLAKEGALKIKETSYINTTAYPTGEFMHGHVAILNKKSAVIILIDEENLETCINSIQKIKKSYNPFIIAISDKNAPEHIYEFCNKHITINTKNQVFAIFATLISLQLIAFECAKKLNRNIDKPVGLSKVVKN